MAEPPSHKRPLSELVNRVLATTDTRERARLVAELGRGSRTAEQIVALTDQFLGYGAAGHLPLLDWIVRARAAIPAAAIPRIIPLLADHSLPIPARVGAAARAIRSLPDTLDAIRAPIRALTKGLSPLRGLERLRQLQHQLDRSRALDTLIERREQRVKLDCPRCGVQLPRIPMLQHLWHAHGLLIDKGKVRGQEQQAEDFKQEYAASRDTTALDRAAVLVGPAALRAWVAATDPPIEDTGPLLATAREHGAGLCPGCLGELPPLGPLPPPLTLSGGRLAGDGYVVDVRGKVWIRTLTVSLPNRVIRSGPDRGRLMSPRGGAGLAALAFLVIALACAVLAPRKVDPVPFVLGSISAAIVAYVVLWILRKPLPNPSERAIDAAWSILARRLVGRDDGARFLTRLCRTSLGRGNPVERVGLLSRILEMTRSTDSDEDLRLRAAAALLQVDDSSRFGRDRVTGVAGIVAAGFREDLPTPFAEYVTEAYLEQEQPPSPGELARLRILLLGAAFDAGLRPRDLLSLFAAAPNLRRAMAVEPIHRLGLLFGVWSQQQARRWERVAPADSVFELCRSAPNISTRVMLEYPDLLLYHRPADPTAAEELGPVLTCARGIVIAGRLVTDPYAEVEVARGGRSEGPTVFIFGQHRLPLSRPPGDDFANAVHGWLRFRVTAILPYIDTVMTPGSPEALMNLLRSFRRRCGYCGTVSAVVAGQIGATVAEGTK